MNVRFESIDGVVHASPSLLSHINFPLSTAPEQSLLAECSTTGKISGQKRSPINQPSSAEQRPSKQAHCYSDASIYDYEPLSPIGPKKCLMQPCTISLVSPKKETLTPEEKCTQLAEIADILDQASRVALEIGSLYTNNNPTETNGHRRYQRRNSFVDRRRFLAPALVMENNDTVPTSGSAGIGINDSVPDSKSKEGSLLCSEPTNGGCPPSLDSLLPLRHSFPPLGRRPYSSMAPTTVRSAFEAEYFLRRSNLPLSCRQITEEKNRVHS